MNWIEIKDGCEMPKAPELDYCPDCYEYFADCTCSSGKEQVNPKMVQRNQDGGKK
jgi:hypothetical protein